MSEQPIDLGWCERDCDGPERARELASEVRRLQDAAETDVGLMRSIIAAREHSERTLTTERDSARDAIARVWALDPADHATSSRDYGRGYAQALRDVHAALDGS